MHSCSFGLDLPPSFYNWQETYLYVYPDLMYVFFCKKAKNYLFHIYNLSGYTENSAELEIDSILVFRGFVCIYHHIRRRGEEEEKSSRSLYPRLQLGRAEYLRSFLSLSLSLFLSVRDIRCFHTVKWTGYFFHFFFFFFESRPLLSDNFTHTHTQIFLPRQIKMCTLRARLLSFHHSHRWHTHTT